MPSPHNALEGPRAEKSFDLKNISSDERISIIIVHNDRPEYLNICLQTITVTSLNNNYEIIVVDNGSDQTSQAFLDQLENDGIKVIRNNENLLWTKAANQGAKAASKDSKYLVFMHHDINVLNPAWLDLMINVSDSNKSGLVGMNLRKYEINSRQHPFVDESCMLVTRECWEDVGPFREELPQEGASFLFTFKANRRGYNPQSIDQAKTMPCIHHYRIFALDINEYERISEKAEITMMQLIQEIQKE